MTAGKDRSFFRRITLGMSGQAFCRIVQATYTVVLVPLLIRAWGLDGYGQWIALTALASYLGLSNFGLVTTAANEIVIAHGAGDLERARTTFQAALHLALFFVLPLIAAAVLILHSLPLTRGLNLTQIGSMSALVILAACGAGLWLQTLRGIVVAALYANGAYAFAYYVQGALKLIELGALALVVGVRAGSQVSAAVVIALVNLCELLVVTAAARRLAPWIHFRIGALDRSWLAAHARPALGFMLSNFSTGGVMLQGPRVVLSALVGGQAVAIYSVYSTAMRFVDQLLLSLVLPLEIEMAQCAGRRQESRIYDLVIKGTHVSWVLFALVACGLQVFGPEVFRIWTGHRIEFSHILMLYFIAMSGANLVGRVSLHALICTNRLFGTSFVLLVTALLGLGIGATLTLDFGVRGMIAGGVASEIANSVVFIRATAGWLGKPPMVMLRDLLDVRHSVAQTRRLGLALTSRRRAGG